MTPTTTEPVDDAPVSDVDRLLRAIGAVLRVQDAIAELIAPGHCPGCQLALLQHLGAREEEIRRAWKRMPAAALEVAATQRARRAEWDAAHARLEAAARGEQVPEYSAPAVTAW